MFHSPVYDVTLGLVLIFLLYSLLATTIQEMMAAWLGLRARMLRNAIVDHLLSNTPKVNRWKSILKGFADFFREILTIITGKRDHVPVKLGEHFYNHPLIKGYGASRVFPLPSYIPVRNFSSVLIDLLKNEFDKHAETIINEKISKRQEGENGERIREELLLSTDLVKVKEVLDFYKQNRTKINNHDQFFLEEETVDLLQHHLKESRFNPDRFKEKLEKWFEDAMGRVTGWYKRQTQTILFFLGLVLAGLFNVDTLEIAHRLSIDQYARKKMAELAVQSIESYKADPRMTHPSVVLDSAFATDNVVAYKKYQRQLDSLVRAQQSELSQANDLLGLGWNHSQNYSSEPLTFYAKCKRAVGWLLTALAICLGAPFWFDLLNKIVRLRSTGKKEDGDAGIGMQGKTAITPLVIRTQTNEEAVG